MANEYLKRTPTSTGNRKVWTWSGWIKRHDTAKRDRFFVASDGAANATYTEIEFNDNDKFRMLAATEGSAADISRQVTQVSRDPGSWQHILVALDTTMGRGTSADASERIKFYINGSQITEFDTSTLPNVNAEFQINNVVTHLIGYDEATLGGNYSNIEGFDWFLVDGQALTPDVFGFYKEGKGYVSAGSTQATDFRPGQWVPKAPRTIKTEINRRGGFGVNGFYLPMNDSSNVGADFHCTPNSIITLKGEDLPQPRNGAPTTSDAYVSQLRSDPYAANLVLAVPGISTSTSANLVTNGTFDTNTTGWTAGNSGTLSVDAGRLKVTNGTSSAGYAYQAITVEVGKRYTVNLEGITGTSASNTRIGTAVNAADYGNKIGSGLVNISLTATSTTLYVTLKPNSNTNGNNAFFDNVVVKQEDAPRDYSADIKGSGTNKSLTVYDNAGVGYELGGYYGSALTFDASGDAMRAESNADFNLGNGDYTIEGWFYRDITDSHTGSHCLWAIGGVNNEGTLALFYEQNGYLMLRGRTPGDGTWTNIIYVVSHNHPVQQWAHICTERYDGVTTVYLNGVAIQTDLSDSTTVSQGYFAIGGFDSGGSYSFDGYIQDVRVYKGVAKYKGGFDVPKPYTPVGIESWRQVPDTTANNFASMNPLSNGNVVNGANSTISYTNGNSTVSWSGVSNNATFATVGFSTGQWYWEGRIGTVGGAYPFIGISSQAGISACTVTANNGIAAGSAAGPWYGNNGLSAGDVIGIAVGFTNTGIGSTFRVFKNGTEVTGQANYYNNSTNFTNQTNTWVPSVSALNGSVWDFNFGQNPTFSGNTTAGTYTDANGKGLFKYEPPSGFLALCEDNLPTPAIADPGKHFKTVLWRGDGNNGHSITGVGFQPDLVWLKERTSTSSHQWHDSVRGAGNVLISNSTNAQAYSATYLYSLDSDGFTLGTSGGVNASTDEYVAWCWKAGGAAVSNTDGTITSQVSANQDAGFSIVKWTSNGATSVVATGHGLAKTPKFMLLKRTVAADNWFVYHESIQTNNRQYVRLNTTDSTVTSPNDFWSTSSSTFGIRQSSIATNGQDCIAYCWAEVEGFSKFGSYIGNGNADGPFVYCGFKPAFVMIKATNSVTNWNMWDSSRSPINPANNLLRANSSAAEIANYSFSNIDILSNGFKLRTNSGDWNGNTYNFVFMAFAESPFQTANSK